MTTTKLMFVTPLLLILGGFGVFLFAAPGKDEAKKDSEMAESEAVRVEGLEFVTVIPKRISLPLPIGGRDVELGLRITNVSNKPITISIFDVIRPSIFSTVDGANLGTEIGRDGKPKPLPPVTIAAGASWMWHSQARLDMTGDRATLVMSGPDGRGVPGFWSITTLKAGKHRLSIEYANSEKKQGDTPIWVGKATTKEAEFEILHEQAKKNDDGMAASKAIRVNGADFQAVVEPLARVPAAGSVWPLNLGLRVTNASDKPLTFYEIVRFTLTVPDGTVLEMGGGTDERTIDAYRVAPGKDVLLPGHVPTEAWLQWTSDGRSLEIRSAARGGSSVDQTGFSWWYGGLKPGRYRLNAEYELKESPNPAESAWLGKVKTETVEFEIVEGHMGLGESKPERVNGVDFQAVAAPNCAAPNRAAPVSSGSRSLDIGLTLKNSGDKEVLFNLFDTVRPVLKSTNGNEFEGRKTRLRSFIPAPVIVGPGQAATVWYRSRLKQLLPDEKTFSLTVPDACGGTWIFDGLAPGEYLLSFEYENTELSLWSLIQGQPNWEKRKGSFWAGNVLTKDVSFKILPAPGNEK